MKKRTLNKLFSISLTAAMALGMLSGCGNTASNTDTASPAETGTATTESTDTASSGDKTTISIYRASFNQATVDSDCCNTSGFLSSLCQTVPADARRG